MGRRDIADQRVAGGAANTLADPVDEAGGENQTHRAGERKQRLGDRGQAVTDHGEEFALAQIVAKGSGKNLGDRCRCLGNTFDQPDR
ncbi:MAG: hypothetical protein ACI8S3_001318 [Alphaproteobacteria bacterium]|jgi:hypothetical protein